MLVDQKYPGGLELEQVDDGAKRIVKRRLEVARPVQRFGDVPQNRELAVALEQRLRVRGSHSGDYSIGIPAGEPRS